MKKYLIVYVVVFILTGYVFGQHMHKSHSEGSSHSMGKLIIKDQKDGLKIEGYCNDIKSAMKEIMKNSGVKIDESKLNPDITHHISFFIIGEDTVGGIKDVKLTIKRVKSEKTYTLMMMKNHYGSDVSLKDKGSYQGVLVIDTMKKGKITFTFTFNI